MVKNQLDQQLVVGLPEESLIQLVDKFQNMLANIQANSKLRVISGNLKLKSPLLKFMNMGVLIKNYLLSRSIFRIGIKTKNQKFQDQGIQRDLIPNLAISKK